MLIFNSLFKKRTLHGRYIQRKSYALKFYTRTITLTSTITKRKSLHQELAENKRYVESLEKQIEKLERLAGIGTAASMILHEMNNLLTPLGNYAALALRNPQDESLTQKALQKAKKNCEQAAKVTEAVLGMTNGKNNERKTVKLAELVDEVFECLCRDFSKDSITVKKEISSDLTMCAAPVKLEQLIMNLVLNSRAALLETGGGTLNISGEQCGQFIKIKVSDTGCGMDEETAGRVFEPLFTTRANGGPGKSGAGLGLAFCKKVAEEHGGTISVESEPGTGSTFTIMLPRN
jgi:signal transduction histidine kinase